jgi:hypothetical protein
MHFTQITDMPRYHNLEKYKNQKGMGLKFRKKFCDRVSVSHKIGGDAR